MMNEFVLDIPNDLWFKDDENQKYAIIIMYSVGNGTPRFVSSSAMYRETVERRIAEMHTAFRNGDLVCLNSHFINPRYIISIKVDLWKERSGNRFDGEYYE